MAGVYSVERRVEFCETDAAGIAHFASFLCYMEQAEHAFLRHLGMSVLKDLGDGWHLTWPRVHVECDYRGAAYFESCLRVEVRVMKVGERSVTYGFRFLLDADCIASGKVVVVCCKMCSGQPLQSTAIAADVRSKLEVYLQETVDS